MKRLCVVVLLVLTLLTPNIFTSLALCETAQGELQKLDYNQAVMLNGLFQYGSWGHISYEEALRYFPSLPLPKEYKGCPIEACIVALYDETLPPSREEGKIFEIDELPKNILRIEALYSNGVISYRLDFNTLHVDDGRARRQVDDSGFLLMASFDQEQIAGVFMQDGSMSLSLEDGHAIGLFEIAQGVHIHQSKAGTSEVTEENAKAVLTDPELLELFDALSQYVRT